ncbi:MAG TPA: S41 family peptidase [Terriglobales bacterium]
MRRIVSLVFALAFFAAIHSYADSTYDPKPWLDDLAEMRAAFTAKYANFEWAVFGKELDMTGLFADTKKRIEAAHNDADARAAFDRLIRKVGDGHVELHWPSGTSHADAPPMPCSDYDPVRAAKPLAAYAQGYVAIPTPQSDIFPIGVITTGTNRVGVIKIPLFSPTAFPPLCQAALAALSIPPDKPCDDACDDRIQDWAAARLNQDFIAQIEALKRAQVDVLLVDVAGNGGGTEWAEAAARMLTPIRLQSARIEFVRGPHWVKELGDLENTLRTAATTASPQDRAMLLQLADQAAAKKQIAATPCDASPLWEGKHPGCTWLGPGFFMSGPLAAADPASLRGKPWAADVFSPMEFQYTEGLWRGPLIVLVDGNSGSSSEEFAALLQDNRAAVIMGELTVGVGCGHTDGGTPTTLSHSGAQLIVPDCVRLRPDGVNEVRGVMPDVVVGFQRGDGPHLRATAFLALLPQAVERARAQHN